MQNAKRMGEKNPAVYLIAGILSLVLIAIASWLIPIPKDFPNIIIPLVIALIAKQIIEAKQGKLIKERISSGEKAESWWKVLGISVICFILALTIMLAIFYLFPNHRLSN